MNIRTAKLGMGSVALAGLLLAAGTGSAMAQHAGGHSGGGAVAGGAHQHLDSRFSHNQYYFDRGYSIGHRPAGGFGEFRGRDGGRYWFHGGNWYRWGGSAWVVWGAPLGLYVPFLPPYFTTVWWGGIPYYYANDTYYLWDDARQQYQVTAPPSEIASGGAPQVPVSDQLFVYPQKGQSAEVQAKDRFECHRWAADSSGFDPTVGNGGAPAEQVIARRKAYFRAEMACLRGRGYSVE